MRFENSKTIFIFIKFSIVFCLFISLRLRLSQLRCRYPVTGNAVTNAIASQLNINQKNLLVAVCPFPVTNYYYYLLDINLLCDSSLFRLLCIILLIIVVLFFIRVALVINQILDISNRNEWKERNKLLENVVHWRRDCDWRLHFTFFKEPDDGCCFEISPSAGSLLEFVWFGIDVISMLS